MGTVLLLLLDSLRTNESALPSRPMVAVAVTVPRRVLLVVAVTVAVAAAEDDGDGTGELAPL